MDSLSYINTFLSQNLPQKVIITQCDEPTFDVAVVLNTTVIYNTTLEAIGTTGYFYDLNVIVHEYMKSHGISYGKLEFHAYFDSGMASSETQVVYSSIASGEEFDEDFLRTSYLTTRSYYTIPRGYALNVAFFNEEDDQSPYGKMILTVRYNDGSIHSVEIEHILYDFRSARVYSFNISAYNIDAKLKEVFPSQPMKVLGGAVVHGDRYLQFFFVDEQPQTTFFFFNAFNIMETAFIYGTQTTKFDVSMKEAACNGRLIAYNRQSERKYQIETVPMSMEEALWLNQFLESPRILYIVSADYDDDVLISDVSCEVSDSAKEQTIIKFSYKLASQHDWHVSPYQQQVFNRNFNEPFQ